jgi:Carboxypeptidase regulatory-like domain
MRYRALRLLRYVIWVCAFGVASCLVVARPAAALQVHVGSNGTSDASSGTGQYKLSGTVVDAVTGVPIRRAMVQLMGMQAQAVLTDEGGKFRFENLAQGQAVIYAHKPGYTDSSGESPVRVMIGANTSPLVLKLDPESAIAVKVTGEDGEGVEGLPVRVLGSQVQQGRRYWEYHGGGQTDEQGEYRAGNLVPGKYYVSVGPSFRPVGHVGDGAQGSDVGYPRVFYPNATELEGAAAVEVNPGRRARLELALSTVPVYRISGAVVGGPPGRPCYPQLTDSSGEDIAIGVRANPVTGVFRSGEVPAGSYTLVADCTAEGGISLAGRMPLHVDSNITNVTLSLAPTASIPVDFRTNEASAGANENNPTGRIILMKNQRSGRLGAAWSEQEPDGDEKHVVVKNVEPGAYSVDIHPNYGWYVESALYGSVDLLAEDLTVPEGETTEAIEITLRNDGARVSGTIRTSGSAPANGMALLVSSRAPRLVRVAQIVNGTFTVRDLAPGSYRALAIDRADDLEYANPEALRDYLTKAQDVTLSAKQESHLELELLHREK